MIKTNFYNWPIIIVCVLMIFFSGCKKEAPTVTTTPVKNITPTTAETGGSIKSDGRSEITSYGICWGTEVNPTVDGIKTTDTIVKKEFTTIINNLTPGRTYYIRAYAINAAGTGYGEQISFTAPVSVPIIKSSEITDISVNSATAGGVIIANGGYPVIGVGVCWDTVNNPTTSGSKTIDKPVLNEFISYVTGLMPNRTYYIRAYAQNSIGTAYGEEKEFTTTRIPPLITTATITDTQLYSASCSVLINSDGGSKISEYGICWNTMPDPTINDFKTNKQVAGKKFRLKDLKPGTLYYVRSYAINTEGIGYGKPKTFRTLGTPPIVTTLAVSDPNKAATVVKAVVNAGYLPTRTSFEYGTSDKYGQSTKISKSLISGESDTIITAQLTDLEPGNTYHFRAKAENALGTSYGNDMTFLILMVPTITGLSPIVKNYHDTVFYITPPASNSSGKFMYSSSNPAIAVIDGNKLTITGSGTCIITATQAPYGNFTSGSVSTTFSMNLVDIDKNVYHTISIGTQDWMKENLKVTRYRNGDPIPNVKDNKTWTTLLEGAYCWFNNDSLKVNPAYGAIYNWYAATDPRKLCPTGWHLPTDAEWQIMERYLGMTFKQAGETILRGPDQGLKLKDTVGWVKNGNGNNTSEFSALPAGLRYASTGEFFNTGIDACWWTATEEDTYTAWLRDMYYYYNSIYRIPDSKSFGFSVRCVRDVKR